MSYESCRAAFNASISAPPTNPWSILQDQLYVWQVREYGVPRPTEMTLGVVEELGELYDATAVEDVEDAFADVTIYAAQLAVCYRLDLGELVKDAVPGDWSYLGSISDAGRLCHCVLKSEQGIRGMADPETSRRAVYDALVTVIGAAASKIEVKTLLSAAEAKYLRIVTDVAAKVMARKKAELPMVTR